MRLPKWITAWLDAAGVSADAFLTVFEAAAAKLDAPAELVDAVSLWVQENVKVQLKPEVVLAFAALVVAELKSGAPGYDPDSGMSV